MTVDYWGKPQVADGVLKILPEDDSDGRYADAKAKALAEELGEKAQSASRDAKVCGFAVALTALSYPLWNGPWFDWHHGNTEVIVTVSCRLLLFAVARAMLACRKASDAQFRVILRYLERPLEGRIVPERRR
ncbi:hypothetical protein [Falsiroseomonas sp. HW251]|uniref:hypothetical protein n=1 Tax=Falsiroseomonas sp. HW251 TaxID=3390998 RepID=UPI003D320736